MMLMLKTIYMKYINVEMKNFFVLAIFIRIFIKDCLVVRLCILVIYGPAT